MGFGHWTAVFMLSIVFALGIGIIAEVLLSILIYLQNG